MDVRIFVLQWYRQENGLTLGADGLNPLAFFDSHMTETEGYELMQDENGRVCGVKARSLVDGTEYVSC